MELKFILDPEGAKRILASEDGKKLAMDIARIINSLNDLSQIQLTDPVEYTIEGKARMFAAEKISEVFAIFLRARDIKDKEPVENQYAVDVP